MRSGKFAKQALNAGRECGQRLLHTCRSRTQRAAEYVFGNFSFSCATLSTQRPENTCWLPATKLFSTIDRSRWRATGSIIVERRVILFLRDSHSNSLRIQFLPRILDFLDLKSMNTGTNEDFGINNFSGFDKNLKISKFYEPRYLWILRSTCFNSFDTIFLWRFLTSTQFLNYNQIGILILSIVWYTTTNKSYYFSDKTRTLANSTRLIFFILRETKLGNFDTYLQRIYRTDLQQKKPSSFPRSSFSAE